MGNIRMHRRSHHAESFMALHENTCPPHACRNHGARIDAGTQSLAIFMSYFTPCTILEKHCVYRSTRGQTKSRTTNLRTLADVLHAVTSAYTVNFVRTLKNSKDSKVKVLQGTAAIDLMATHT